MKSEILGYEAKTLFSGPNSYQLTVYPMCPQNLQSYINILHHPSSTTSHKHYMIVNHLFKLIYTCSHPHVPNKLYADKKEVANLRPCLWFLRSDFPRFLCREITSISTALRPLINECVEKVEVVGCLALSIDSPQLDRSTFAFTQWGDSRMFAIEFMGYFLDGNVVLVLFDGNSWKLLYLWGGKSAGFIVGNKICAQICLSV